MVGELDSYMQKNETQAPTYTIHKNKFKMVKYLNISHDTIKVLEENIGRKISDIPCSNISTDMSPRARDINEILNKWDYIKIKSSARLKKTALMKSKPTIWETIFANDISDKGLISKIYRELHSRKTNNPIKNGQRT